MLLYMQPAEQAKSQVDRFPLAPMRGVQSPSSSQSLDVSLTDEAHKTEAEMIHMKGRGRSPVNSTEVGPSHTQSYSGIWPRTGRAKTSRRESNRSSRSQRRSCNVLNNTTSGDPEDDRSSSSAKSAPSRGVSSDQSTVGGKQTESPDAMISNSRPTHTKWQERWFTAPQHHALLLQ